MNANKKCSFEWLALTFPLVLSILLSSCARISAPAVSGVEQDLRISPQAAYQLVKEGKAVLVCTYYDERTCRRLRIDNAISLSELEWNIRHGYISPQKEIIFYCA